MTKHEVETLWNRALAAGIVAYENCRPRPMRLRDGNQVYDVDGGACGFAWVTIRPCRGPLVAYLKEKKLGRKGWEGGLVVWMGKFFQGQSIERKEAAARAIAAVLKEAGVDAYADSRLD
jgi:hypothetical protein